MNELEELEQRMRNLEAALVALLPFLPDTWRNEPRVAAAVQRVIDRVEGE